MAWFPILLVAHIMLALSLLLPSLLLPFLLRGGSADGNQRPGPLAAPLLRLQGTGSVVIGIGLAITGAGLLAVLGPDLLRKPWLLAALGIYAVNLLVAGLVSRPNLRRLLGMREPRTQPMPRRGAAELVGSVCSPMPWRWRPASSAS